MQSTAARLRASRIRGFLAPRRFFSRRSSSESWSTCSWTCTRPEQSCRLFARQNDGSTRRFAFPPLFDPRSAPSRERSGDRGADDRRRTVGPRWPWRKPDLKFPAGQDEQTCAAFLSTDGGANWARHDFDVTWCADPWAVFTPDGQALVTLLGKHPALAAQGAGGLVALHSPDGGRTWDSLPVGLGRSHDHSTMAVDLSQGKRRGWIYVSSHRLSSFAADRSGGAFDGRLYFACRAAGGGPTGRARSRARRRGRAASRASACCRHDSRPP